MPARSAAARDRRHTLLAAALIVACGVAAWANGFTDLYIGLDGKESIRDNVHIRTLWPPGEALSLPTWDSPDPVHGIPTVAHRPTLSLTLALTRAVAGPGAKAQHAVNLAIHIAAALLLFGLVRRTLAAAHPHLAADAGTRLALASALLWLLHPLQTQSVTYIVQRSESLMGLLLIATVYCGVRARGAEHRRAWQALAVLACFVGAGAKQTAALAPLLLLAWDHTFAPADEGKRYRPAFYLAVALPAWALLSTISGKASQHLGLGPVLEFALQQPRVIVHYLRLTLWPDDLFLYVNTRLFAVDGALDVIPYAVVLAALAGGTLVALWRRHGLGFLGVWFFVTLAPTSSVLPIADSIQEHRMYVPLAALAVLAVVAGRALLERLAVPRLDARARQVVGAALLVAVLVGLGVRTHVRNRDYHREFGPFHGADLHENYRILADHAVSRGDILALEEEAARAVLAQPDADPRAVPYAWLISGLAQARAGRTAEAVADLQRLIALAPEFAYARHQLGVVLLDGGDPAAAIAALQEAVRLEPAAPTARKDLALARKAAGDVAGARAELDAALRTDPAFAEAHYELGILAVEDGDRAAAAEHFRRAIDGRADFAEAYLELGMLRAQDGAGAEAEELLRAALRWNPELAPAHYELGLVLGERDDAAAAVAQFREAVRLDPEHVEAQKELGIALAASGDMAGARAALERALERDPELADARAMLGLVARSQGDLAQAARHLEAAQRLAPGDERIEAALADVRRRLAAGD